MSASGVRTIDLNIDAGESSQRLADGSDEVLLRYVSSVNIACGGHAGDAATMEATVRLARRLGVAIGAHPSYPDRARFGRFEMMLSADEVEAAVTGQIETLRAITERLGASIVHVKPHGALYHAVSRRPEIAAAVARAGRSLGPSLRLVAIAGSPAIAQWSGLGFRVAGEGFADRSYAPDGTLVPRGTPGAVIVDPEQAARQALRLAEGDEPRVETICVHSDTPAAESIARAVRAALEARGFTIASPGIS